MPAKPKRRITKTTSIIITVTNGVPSQPSVQISKTQRVVFVNTDNTEYLFELWNQDNDDHIVVCPVLAANASLTFQADLDDLKPESKCHYNIEVVGSARKRNRSDGGGHVIIIGN
jgi:hypothetical protein